MIAGRTRKETASTRVIPSSDGRFVLEVYANDADGVRRRRRLRFRSELAAKKKEAEVLRRVENGLPPFPEKREAPATNRDVLAGYHEGHVPDTRPKSQKRMKDHRRELEALIGDELAEQMPYEGLLRYRRQRKDDHRRRTGRALSDVTVKKEFAHLRAALRYAKVNGRIRFHVFEKLTEDMRANLFPRENKSAGQVIEDEDFGAIVANLLPIYRPVVGLMRLTGMRKGEVCGLRWSDIRRDRIAISDAPGNKTGSRDVPLTPAMKALLPPRRLDGSALVFEQGGRSFYDGLGQAWAEAREKAGHPTIRLHDIRHTVATELDELGDRVGLKTALGMSDVTVARYAEHRKFDRAVALFDKYETRHKFVTTANQDVAE